MHKAAVDDVKNGKKSMCQVTASKRYSIDNYCSNWLSNACKSTHTEQDLSSRNDKINSYIANDKTVNGHEHHSRILEANKLLHRRSLSENIIPFPPHTTPSDKARCHLINRRNSQLNASSGERTKQLHFTLFHFVFVRNSFNCNTYTNLTFSL